MNDLFLELWSRNIMFVLHNICKHGIRRQKMPGDFHMG